MGFLLASAPEGWKEGVEAAAGADIVPKPWPARARLIGAGRSGSASSSDALPRRNALNGQQPYPFLACRMIAALHAWRGSEQPLHLLSGPSAAQEMAARGSWRTLALPVGLSWLMHPFLGGCRESREPSPSPCQLLKGPVQWRKHYVHRKAKSLSLNTLVGM